MSMGPDHPAQPILTWEVDRLKLQQLQQVGDQWSLGFHHAPAAISIVMVVLTMDKTTRKSIEER